MKIMQIITDYIRRSILTVQGDLVVRGAAVPEALAAGIIGTILSGKGAGVLPAYENFTGAVGTVLAGQGAGVVSAYGVPSMEYINKAVGNFTRDAPGEEVVTGVGFAPKLYLFFSTDTVPTTGGFVVGYDDLTNRICAGLLTGASTSIYKRDKSLYMMRSTGNYIQGYVSATSGDGFTILFDESGSGYIQVHWFVFG